MKTCPDGSAAIGPELRYAILELSLRCNLSCIHCASAAGRAREFELDLPAWHQVVGDLAALGRPAVDLMGGEALLSPLLLPVGRALFSAGMPWGLLTNGWHLTERRASELVEVGCRGVGISLDGASEETHDRIRGRRGAFERALDAIDVMTRLPFKPANRSVLTSVNKDNLAELPAMGALLSQRAPGVRWQLNLTTSSSERMPDGMLLDADGIRRLVEFVRAARAGRVHDLALSLAHDVGYFVGDTELHDHTWRGCPAGMHHLGIQSDGRVKGCLALPEALGVASVRERSLIAIWHDDALWRQYRQFEASQAGAGCRDCSQVGECRGGCLAYSLARTGQPHSHPDCLFRGARSAPGSHHRSRLKRLPLAVVDQEPGRPAVESDQDDASTQPSKDPGPYTGPLKYACIELTRRCNLRCVHCGSNAGTARREALELSEFIPIFRDLRRLGGERVVLLGGEPLVHPDWAEVAEMARLFQLKVAFVTNGTRVTAPRARRLAELSTHVGVSIDGADPAIHDGVRGRAGALRGAWRGIERLLDAGARVTVITTLWQMTLGELPRLRDQLIGRGLVWQLQLATASGERFLREQLLRPEQALAVARFIAETRATVPREELRIAGGHSIGYHAASVSDYAASGAWQGCPGGIASLGISADGRVKGCLSMRASDSVGSVRERDLFELWRDPRSFSRRRTARRESLTGGCRLCPHADTCLAGCPAMASSVTGSPDDNPMCLRRAEAGALA